MIELAKRQKDRVVFAGSIFGLMQTHRGAHPCTTFLCAEDGYQSWFHACFCTPGTVTIRRVERGENDGGEVSEM